MANYPDSTLKDEARKASLTVRSLWLLRGPKNTAIAWIECLLVGRSIVHVVTYEDGDGWDALVSVGSNKVEDTIKIVVDRVRGMG